MFYSGISFSAFETLKAVGADSRSGELTTPLRFCFGAVSGVVAQTCTYPLDVVRRRMQVRAAVAGSSVQFAVISGTVWSRATDSSTHSIFTFSSSF